MLQKFKLTIFMVEIEEKKSNENTQIKRNKNKKNRC
jgi:hypothetical protein